MRGCANFSCGFAAPASSTDRALALSAPNLQAAQRPIAESPCKAHTGRHLDVEAAEVARWGNTQVSAARGYRRAALTTL